MRIGVIVGDVRANLSPRDHLDALLRQVEAAQRYDVTYVTIGQHYLYGDAGHHERWPARSTAPGRTSSRTSGRTLHCGSA